MPWVLSGDNASINKMLVSKIQRWILRTKGIDCVISFLGCKANLLNLAVNEFLSLYDSEVQKVHNLMISINLI